MHVQLHGVHRVSGHLQGMVGQAWEQFESCWIESYSLQIINCVKKEKIKLKFVFVVNFQIVMLKCMTSELLINAKAKGKILRLNTIFAGSVGKHFILTLLS